MSGVKWVGPKVDRIAGGPCTWFDHHELTPELDNYREGNAAQMNAIETLDRYVAKACAGTLVNGSTGRGKWDSDRSRNLYFAPLTIAGPGVQMGELRVSIGERKLRLYYSQPKAEQGMLLGLLLGEKTSEHKEGTKQQNGHIKLASHRHRRWSRDRSIATRRCG